MESGKPSLGFKINKIETEQFAVIEEAFLENEKVLFNYGFSFGTDQKLKIIGAFASFRFLTNDKPFLILKAGCYFSTSDDLWDSFKIKDSNQLKLNKDFLCHLMMIAVGTSRGILHAKTENTLFNKFVIPTLNIEESIKEDMIIE